MPRSVKNSFSLWGWGLLVAAFVAGPATAEAFSNSGRSEIRSETTVTSYRTGTAFVVDSSGLLLTCYHVVRSPGRIEVLLDDRQYTATLVRSDPEHDLAVLQLRAEGPFTALPLAREGADTSGAAVSAFGYPLAGGNGETMKVTRGTVSGSATVSGEAALQVDIQVKPGNSGSPLVDSHGRVVGIIRARYTDAEALGIAVPAETARQLLGGYASVDPQPFESRLSQSELDRHVARCVAYLRVFPASSSPVREVETPAAHPSYTARQPARSTMPDRRDDDFSRIAPRMDARNKVSAPTYDSRDDLFRRGGSRRASVPAAAPGERDSLFRRN